MLCIVKNCAVKSAIYISVFVLFFSSVIFQHCLAWDLAAPQEEGNQQCAHIFFQSSFQGPSFLLKDDEQISNLADIQSYYLKAIKRRNSAIENAAIAEDSNETLTNAYSFQVENGCQLRVAALPYLKGSIHEFLGDIEEIPADWFIPRSIACECPKLCQCEDVKLRRSECARAYIKNDCTNCKATFTSLKAAGPDGNNSSTDYLKFNTFPERWSSQVTSIVLRNGCNLTMQFSKAANVPPSFDFTASQVTNNVTTDFGNLTHYICQCNDDRMTSEDQGESTNITKYYPPLISIPRTKGAINMLLSSRDDLLEHPGLVAALQSLRSRKSSKNAYILLLGMTGSGKSSAVNLLFDHPNITKVGDFVSTTKDIIQFTIPVPVVSLGMSNTALHVIDTPGIGDTSGIAEDARFLGSLDDFLSSHNDLRRSLPNVVLIFSKFSDNRFSGEGSAFVKMLRTVDLFKERLIDKRSTNVIFVLTHYMSETKEITRDPSKRIAAVRRVVQEFSTLPRPIHIVLAENKPEESHLLNVNGFYQLPNGEYYPKNLFDQMQRNLVSSEDPVGEAIIRDAFSNSDHFQIQARHYPLLSRTHEKVTQFLGVLGAFNKPIADTEVSRQLRNAYDNVDPALKAKYPDELNFLQRKLYARNILQAENLPRISIYIVKLMEEIQVNPLTLFLLENAFNLTVPEFPAGLVVGSGYSLTNDMILPGPIFNANESIVETNDFLFKVPRIYKVVLDHGIDNHFQVFTKKNELVAARMNLLNVPPGILTNNVNSNGMEAYPLLPGFNLISLQEEQNVTSISWDSLTATVDYHTFQISLNDKAELCTSFINDVADLRPMNLSDPENIQRWRDFFGKYGTHVVANAFGGGSIVITTQVDKSLERLLTTDEKFSILSESLANITQQLGNELIGRDGRYSPPEGVKYHFTQKGGSHKHFWSNFSDLDEIRNVEAWRESLKYEPVVLMNRLQLIPISKVVKDFGQWEEDWEGMIEEAAANLLNASLVYIPIERVNEHDPEARDQTAMEASDYQKMQEFSIMFRTISEASQGAQMSLMTMIKESEAKRATQEEQWQQRMHLALEEQRRKERRLEEEAKHDKDLQLKREQLEMERATQDRIFREQQEESRRQSELQQWLMMKDLQAKNEQNLLSFINAENARRDQIVMSNKKGWVQRLGDFATGGLIGVLVG